MSLIIPNAFIIIRWMNSFPDAADGDDRARDINDVDFCKEKALALKLGADEAFICMFYSHNLQEYMLKLGEKTGSMSSLLMFVT